MAPNTLVTLPDCSECRDMVLYYQEKLIYLSNQVRRVQRKLFENQQKLIDALEERRTLLENCSPPDVINNRIDDSISNNNTTKEQNNPLPPKKFYRAGLAYLDNSVSLEAIKQTLEKVFGVVDDIFYFDDDNECGVACFANSGSYYKAIAEGSVIVQGKVIGIIESELLEKYAY